MTLRTAMSAMGLAALVAIPAVSQTSTACQVTGDLRIIPLHSQIFHNVRNLRVWLPPGYDDSSAIHRRYPVLYLNDGQDLFNACTSTFSGSEWRADETATALIEQNKIPPLIIVGIDNAGRGDRAREYLPFPDDTLSPATPDVHGKDYPRFLLSEVMPLVNRKFRTSRKPADTGLGGSSYGAGIALYTVMQHPGAFGRLLIESPSLYAHDDYLIRRAEHFTQWPSRIFLGVGTVNEPKEDVDRLRGILVRSGLGPDRFVVRIKEGAAHTPEAWAARFTDALLFLYGKSN